MEYQVNVIQDGSNKQRLFVIQSATTIDEKLLRVAGLILDGGISSEQVDELDDTAAAYVSVAK